MTQSEINLNLLLKIYQLKYAYKLSNQYTQCQKGFLFIYFFCFEWPRSYIKALLLV